MKLKKITKQVPGIEKILILFLFFYYILKLIFPQIRAIIDGTKDNFTNYFSDSRLNLIVNAAFILIGIYATITSVFGSSRSAAISKLSKNDLTKKFISYIACAILSALILPIDIIFNVNIDYNVLLVLIVWMFSSLLRFLVVILLIYNYNVDKSRCIDAEEKENYENLIDILTSINIEIKRKK